MARCSFPTPTRGASPMREGSDWFSDRPLVTGEKLETMRKEQPTFRKLPDLVRGKEVFWVKPALVAEVNYCSWTKDGLLRHTSFKRLREDKGLGRLRSGRQPFCALS